jgi:small subunit ribosomal protein S16
MSVKIRLRRMGAKHQPSYRIVIADSRSPRDGRYIDQVGFYNPLTNPAIINLNKDKAIDWLRRGAVPTDTVAKLFTKFDIDPLVVRKPGYVAAGADIQTTPTAAPTQVAGDTGPTE